MLTLRRIYSFFSFVYMTIVDPPIKDTSKFYLNELYLQQNSIVSGKSRNDSSTTLDQKEIIDQYESNEIVVFHGEDDSLENYSIKVRNMKRATRYTLLTTVM